MNRLNSLVALAVAAILVAVATLALAESADAKKARGKSAPAQRPQVIIQDRNLYGPPSPPSSDRNYYGPAPTIQPPMERVPMPAPLAQPPVR
jgi:hypothetical protein